MTNLVLGAGGAAEAYTIDQSLRFNTADSPSLTRTFSAGDRRTWTWSGWVKKSLHASDQTLFSAGTGAYFHIRLRNEGEIVIQSATPGVDDTVLNLYTSAVYRDPSAWYHIVVTIDTTDGTEADRAKVYVNGDRVTDFGTETTISTGSLQMEVNNTVGHGVGVFTLSDSAFLDGYLAEVYFIDGQALDADSFGETDEDTNAWIPKDASDLTFGTTGFYLKFEDSADFGNDSSGNGNDFSATNLVASDQMKDSPTSNFATINPNIKPYGTIVITEGALKIQNNSGSVWIGVGATQPITTGEKRYYEFLTTDTDYMLIGLVEAEPTPMAVFFGGTGYPQDGDGMLLYYSNGELRIDGGAVTTGADAYGVGDIVGVAINMDDLEITFYLNGVDQGTTAFSPYSMSNATSVLPAIACRAAGGIFNFGSDSSFAGEKTAQGNADGNGVGDFYYAPPADYLSLASNNLPDPSITLPGDNYNTVLWTGTGSSNAITGVGFQPDFTWIKNRDSGRSNALYDAIRGATYQVSSDNTEAEKTETEGLKSFDSDGFTVGTENAVNESTDGIVAWNWLAATTFDPEDDGTIAAASGRSNAAAGFSIVKYTGTGSTVTIGHGLASKPLLIIVKGLGATGWPTYQSLQGATYVLFLDDAGGSTNVGVSGYWGDTEPTASVFTVEDSSQTNNTGVEYISYIFHSIEGYSKVGGYTGNANADGTFIYTGFRPAFILIKNITYTSAAYWQIYDNKRAGYNEKNIQLHPNASDAEGYWLALDIVSNGFKMRSTETISNGAYDFLYYAIAESPFKYANAR